MLHDEREQFHGLLLLRTTLLSSCIVDVREPGNHSFLLSIEKEKNVSKKKKILKGNSKEEVEKKTNVG